MPKDKSGNRAGSAANKTTDSRFSNFETDPRFRLPSRKKTKTTIDKRFSQRLKDDDFTNAAAVDRYGRKLKSDAKKKALQRLYQEEEEEEKEEEAGEKDDDAKVDDDEVIQRELRSAAARYDPARGGGFSESESESESDEAEDEDGGAEVESGPAVDRFREEQAGIEAGEVTNRIAIVNLDWDHIKSADLMALFSSFAPAGGRIEKVSIYPSEFGKERMQREELEGPPKEIFKSKPREDDSEEDSEDSESSEDEGHESEDDEALDSDEETKNELIKEGDDKDFDSDALRSYQMDRLRYFYAVMVCSNAAIAQKIYEATDGSEYMSSSNFLDLRFIPDDVTFDDEPRDECDSVPAGYKPIEFVTDALQHSKVKLTWDMHPEELSRKETIRKAFSGSRAEIAENDLRAYLASDSEGEEVEEEEDETVDIAAVDEGPQLTKKELARQKMRAALGLSDEPAARASKTGAPVGDMQITFTAALTEKDPDEATPGVEETTIEKYKRKEKERKAKKKEKALAKREGLDEEAVVVGEAEPTENLGFDDPFFTSEEPAKASKSAIRKEERRQKREAREAEEAASAAEKAQLELLMAEENTNDQAAHLDHFDMNEIVREEKRKGKKKQKGKSGKEERGGLQDEFDLDVADPRFKAVFQSHEFAIDPSNPKFKATSGMKKLLEEGRKRKAGSHGDGEDLPARDKKKTKARHSDVERLVDAVKKKSGKR